MALFSSGSDYEKVIKEKMATLPILDNLEKAIEEDDIKGNPWLAMQQNYYDNRKRIVNVIPDGVEILWCAYHKELVETEGGKPRLKEVTETLGRIAYSFTESGYLPLHPYMNEKGKPVVSVARICNIWASLIRERLSALEAMKDCNFNAVSTGTDSATFTYTVPALTFKDWF